MRHRITVCAEPDTQNGHGKFRCRGRRHLENGLLGGLEQIHAAGAAILFTACSCSVSAAPDQGKQESGRMDGEALRGSRVVCCIPSPARLPHRPLIGC